MATSDLLIVSTIVVSGVTVNHDMDDVSLRMVPQFEGPGNLRKREDVGNGSLGVD